jgi:alkylation response protein AidB-like acyl-CoA dehydrogenase
MSLWQLHADPSFIQLVREFVAQHVSPAADELDREDLYPTEIIREAAKRGLNTLTLPKAYGGSDGTFRLAAALFEEIGFGSATVAISLITIFQAQNIIRRFGNETLKRTYLPQFAKGLIASYALTEKAHGSDIRSLDTLAKRDGSGWIISGEKSFITSGSAAELFIILAQTDLGVSVFAVPRELPGLQTVETDHSATFGLRNGPHVDLLLSDVRVPSDHLIGGEARGLKQVVTNLNYSRMMNAAVSMGIARAAFEQSLHFAKGRKAFDQRVFDFQGIQWYFAEMLTDIDAARLLLYRAADALDNQSEIDRYSSEAKLKCCSVANRVANQAVQVCGAYGTMTAAPFNRYLRDAKTFEIGGGSIEVMKNTIAKVLRSAE